MEPIIKLVDVSKYYHSDTNVAMGLNKINLEFYKNEFIAITGESGSGKTTLLNVIAGLDSYEEGELYINGEPTSHFDADDWDDYRRNQVSFIFQNYNLIDSYTVLENVESVLLIQGYKIKEAREKALTYLAKVGLSDYTRHRATQLSSGQKQRLSIARALAKDTEIIIADEPTGNLDAENGKAILQLLSELSEDKLVLLVTHNYEQAAPFVSRNVRLYDSKVKSDKKVNKRELVSSEEPKKKHDKGNKILSALQFAGLNIKNQPRRVLAIFSLIFLSSLGTFTCFGVFESNADSDNAKIYNKEAFRNGDKTRLLALNADGSYFDEESANQIYKYSKKIEQVDLYGMANDVNYYTQDELMTYKYSNLSEPTLEEHFLRSATSLKQDDLSKGNLPQAYNEIVVYSSDYSVFNTLMPLYVTNTSKWNSMSSEYCMIPFKVVGLLKEKTNQVYFHSDFCRSFGNSCYRGDINLQYQYMNGSYIMASPVKLPDMALVINRELTGKKIRVSKTIYDVLYRNVNVIYPVSPAYTFLEFTSEGSDSLETVYCEIDSDEYLNGTKRIIEVSLELFNMVYGEFESEQVSIFISSYAETNSVINTLNKKGLKSISVFKVSTVEWDEELLLQHYLLLAASILAIGLIVLLEVLISKALLKFKKNDFVILRSLGMGDTSIQLCNYIEILIYFVASIILSLIVPYIVLACVPEYESFHGFLANILSYMRVGPVFGFIAFVLVIGLFVGFIFNRYLKKMIKKVSSLKEDM